MSVANNYLKSVILNHSSGCLTDFSAVKRQPPKGCWPASDHNNDPTSKACRLLPLATKGACRSSTGRWPRGRPWKNDGAVSTRSPSDCIPSGRSEPRDPLRSASRFVAPEADSPVLRPSRNVHQSLERTASSRTASRHPVLVSDTSTIRS